MRQMENTTQFILNEIQSLSKISDLATKTEQLQNLSCLINKNKFLLKKEIPAPKFWDSLDRYLSAALTQFPMYDIKLIEQSNKILIKKETKEEHFDILSPQELRQILSPEEFSEDNQLILHALLSHSAIFLSLNFIVNLE